MLVVHYRQVPSPLIQVVWWVFRILTELSRWTKKIWRWQWRSRAKESKPLMTSVSMAWRCQIWLPLQHNKWEGALESECMQQQEPRLHLSTIPSRRWASRGTATKDGEMFQLATNGFGCLEWAWMSWRGQWMTMKFVVPAHDLLESTPMPWIVRKNSRNWMTSWWRSTRHIQYIWIPCQDWL